MFNTFRTSAGNDSNQIVDIFARTTYLTKEWAQTLQILGICLSLTSLKSIFLSCIFVITQLILVLLSFVLFNILATSLQSVSMVKEDKFAVLTTSKPHSIASASAKLMSFFRWACLMPAETILPFESFMTTWYLLFMVASVEKSKSFFQIGWKRKVSHMHCFCFSKSAPKLQAVKYLAFDNLAPNEEKWKS